MNPPAATNAGGQAGRPERPWFGHGVAGIGDVSGDGVPDVAIGAPESDDFVGENHGRVGALGSQRRAAPHARRAGGVEIFAQVDVQVGHGFAMVAPVIGNHGLMQLELRRELARPCDSVRTESLGLGLAQCEACVEVVQSGLPAPKGVAGRDSPRLLGASAGDNEPIVQDDRRKRLSACDNAGVPWPSRTMTIPL